MEYRIERDSMGEVRVPADRYWGAQTQRSHENFPIGVGIETMPAEIIRAFAVLKKAAAIANRELLPARMSAEKCALIGRVCDEILAGELDGHFPLVVWQTGSGTQSNMNVNEVIANRGNELAGKKLLHPNDDVNMSQSSNDTFPTAMHIAACLAVEDRLLPAVSALERTLLHLEAENADVLKSGRTHLQDATPITFAQEISGWRTSLARDRELLTAARLGLTFDQANPVIFRMSDVDEGEGNTSPGGTPLGKGMVLTLQGGTATPVSDPAVSISDRQITEDGGAGPEPLLIMELDRIYAVDVYFYLEGCDPDCLDERVGRDEAVFNLAFYGILTDEEASP